MHCIGLHASDRVALRVTIEEPEADLPQYAVKPEADPGAYSEELGADPGGDPQAPGADCVTDCPESFGASGKHLSILNSLLINIT